MVDVTVRQLATTFKMDPVRLLERMHQAGLPQMREDEGVSDPEQRHVLEFIQYAATPKDKITIRRKNVSTLRAGGARGAAVQLETRPKKRFVRRTEAPTESPRATLVPDQSEDDAAATAGTARQGRPRPGNDDESEQERRRLDGALEILRRGLERRCDTCVGDDLQAMLKQSIAGFPNLDAGREVLTMLYAALDARNVLCHYRPDRLVRGRALYFLSAIRQLLVELDMSGGDDIDELYQQQVAAEVAQASDDRS